ncbi:hypothetical protein EVAR_4345_1 [Eumeta japonica]|uniref:Uncharacterized protein n=1 Tax=Eumeta variegata TaxID=151549 RepID=A0A4C1VCE4_EUMVA|nr:hypothetical protein EVAR_4345_1 [Eumeta japonica]
MTQHPVTRPATCDTLESLSRARRFRSTPNSDITSTRYLLTCLPPTTFCRREPLASPAGRALYRYFSRTPNACKSFRRNLRSKLRKPGGRTGKGL